MNQKVSMHELGRMSSEEFQAAEKLPVILILDNIRSGLNVGSIFRSADAFRIQKIYCCGYTPAPPHREVLKSALGATDTVAWEYRPDTLALIPELLAQQVTCLAIEQTISSQPLHKFIPAQQSTVALVFGNEVHGVAQEVVNACYGSIEVTQFGTKHSLNVAVCAGIVLYDLAHKIGQPS